MPWWDGLPPSDHPFWRVAQGGLAFLCLVIVLVHGWYGLHNGGVDASDAAGMTGLVVAVRLMLKGLS